MLNERGFTLIEVITAVAILGISLGLILSLFSSGVRTAKVTEQYSRALLLAKEKLAERLVLRDGAPLLLDSYGAIDGYEWELNETPFEDPEGKKSEKNSEFLRVEVKVRWKDGVKNQETSLYGLIMTDRYSNEENL